jgi:hypothetical protein
MMAAYSGHMEIVKLLLGKGAEVNAKANDGGTALSVARRNGHTDIVQLLEKASSVMSVEKRQAKIDIDIDIISNALEVYKKDHGVYPTDQEGLHALLTARTSEPNQTYIATLPKTPGGDDYLYKTSEIWLIYRERTQPTGLGWKWSDRNQSWQRTDNGYLIQVSEPDGMITSIPTKQFGPLPSGVYFAPAGGIR